jgi:hypothetical protein
MKIELSLPRSRFVVDQTMELTLRLYNDGVAPVRVPDPFRNDGWQPTYLITGPAFPEGRRFSARSVTTRDQRPAPADVPLGMVDLAPGVSHQGELPLWAWCPTAVPGAYTLVAELDHGEGELRLVARSQPLSFELEALDTQGVSVGVDVLCRSPADLYVSFLHLGADGPVIYDALLTEARPDPGGVRRASLEPRRAAAPGVGAVLVPWCNVDRMLAVAAWRVWLHEDLRTPPASERERAATESRLVGDDCLLGSPASLPLPPGASLLPPVWQDPAEALDVLVRVPDRRRLQLARFTSHGPPAPPSGAFVWRSDERGAIVAARLAIGPAAQGSLRRAIALEAHGEDLLISCFAVDPSNSEAPIGTLLLPKTNPLPGSSIALRVTAEGHTQVWLLVDAKVPGWQVFLARVTFDRHGRVVGGGDRPAPLVTLDIPLVEAALELVMPDGREPQELVWALRTDDRRVLWSRGGRAPRWYKAPRPSTVAVPMQLRPLAQATYLATLRPGRAPELVTL